MKQMSNLSIQRLIFTIESEDYEVSLRNFELIKKQKILSCRRVKNVYKGILMKNLASVG